MRSRQSSRCAERRTTSGCARGSPPTHGRCSASASQLEIDPPAVGGVIGSVDGSARRLLAAGARRPVRSPIWDRGGEGSGHDGRDRQPGQRARRRGRRAGCVACSISCEVGPARLPGEVIALRGSVTVVQVYEYTGGLAPGEPGREHGPSAHRRARPRAGRRGVRRDAAPAPRGSRCPRARCWNGRARGRAPVGVRCRGVSEGDAVAAGAVLGRVPETACGRVPRARPGRDRRARRVGAGGPEASTRWEPIARVDGGT